MEKRNEAALQQILNMPNDEPISVMPNGDRVQSLNWDQRRALLDLCAESDPAMYETLTKDRSGCDGFRPHKESRFPPLLAALLVMLVAALLLFGLCLVVLNWR